MGAAGGLNLLNRACDVHTQQHFCPWRGGAVVFRIGGNYNSRNEAFRMQHENHNNKKPAYSAMCSWLGQPLKRRGVSHISARPFAEAVCRWAGPK